MIMGINSFTAICSVRDLSSQASWNHSLWCHAPHPQLPEASEVNSSLSFWLLMIRDVPFQWAANVFHHRISDLNSLFKRMWWCLCLAMLRSDIIRRINDLPGIITVQACCRVPTRDSSSWRVQAFFISHALISSPSRSSFSRGSRNTCCIVSISIPKKVMAVLGPSCFSGASGTPRSLYVLARMSRYFWHVFESGGPTTAKSSR